MLPVCNVGHCQWCSSSYILISMTQNCIFMGIKLWLFNVNLVGKTLSIQPVLVGFTTYGILSWSVEWVHHLNYELWMEINLTWNFSISSCSRMGPILFCVLGRRTSLLHWNWQYNVPSIRIYSSCKELITWKKNPLHFASNPPNLTTVSAGNPFLWHTVDSSFNNVIVS